MLLRVILEGKFPMINEGETYWRAEDYGGVRVERDEKHKELMLEEIEVEERAKILDLACGSGFLTFDLARKVPEGEVVGMDISKDMIDDARRKLAESELENVEFKEGNVESLPFDDALFDSVACRFALHHFSNPSEVMDEVYRVLSTGGIFVLADVISPRDERADGFLNERAHFDRTHERFYNEKELEEMMSDFREMGRKYYELEFKMSEMRNSRTAGTRGRDPDTARENFQKFRDLYENAGPKVKKIFQMKKGKNDTTFSWNSVILSLRK